MPGPVPFDPATMPLDGIRLIEASAGTGKTHSLAGLYVRLIVEQRLDVRDILVMTFTRAATQELRERLRERLALTARIAAEPGAAGREDDAAAFAEAVVTAAGEARPAIARRLREAATRVDQATITTIHGFAQKAAAEHAFESSLPFDRGEPVDDREIHREAVNDYWRSQVIGRDAAPARAFLALWPAPETLYQEIREVLDKPHAELRRPDASAVERARRAALQAWQAQRRDFVELLGAALEENALLANEPLKKLLDDDGAEELAATIDAGLGGTADGFPALPAILADLADDAGVRRHAKKAPAKAWFRPQDLPVVPLLAALQAPGRLAAAARAVDTVRALSRTRKRERRLFSFADMISALHDAVQDPAGGPALAAALRRTWPWALVDEFQDTDPVQYAILRCIYGRSSPDSASGSIRATDGSRSSDGAAAKPGEPCDTEPKPGGLILIGDPKQAIYGFRGGDVFAYLDAARDAHGRYGMATNHRSAKPVVAGLDALFSTGGARAFVLDGIGFRRVRAGRSDGDRRIELDGQPLPGVTAWHPHSTAGGNKGDVQARIQTATVARIGALLAGATKVEADQRAPLRPADVAVLVNTNDEAAAIQAALTGAGIPAVCSHQQSVLARPEAQHVLRVLQAAATPFDAERLQVALITPLFGNRFGDLIALDEGDAAWARTGERFQAAHLRWARAGVQAMLEPILQDAAARVLGLTDGERRMTDYLHVADLLQAAEHSVFGMAGLARWLETGIRRAHEGEVAEAERLRLEDDGDQVQITTIHKAKGLQFPVVFVPYSPWLGAKGRPGEAPLVFHDDTGSAVVDLGSADDAANAPRAIRERRAEAVRLLYVALTRAREACFFVHAAASQAVNGPLAWLLHRDDGVTADGWHAGQKPPDWLTAERAAAALHALAATADGALQAEPLPDIGEERAPRPAAAAPRIGPARRDLPAPRRPWSVLSFSHLAGQVETRAEPAAGADDEPEIAPVAPEPSAAEVSTLPRGRGFGQAFHELLERVPFEHWPSRVDALDAATRGTIAEALRRHGVATRPAGDAVPVELAAAMACSTVHEPLPEIGPLAGIPHERRQAELEFFLRLGGSEARALLAAMADAGYHGARAGTADIALRGLMHGFIDLVVEHDGRYWILDYKTNVLGARRADYAPERLAAAVAAHHYDLQYLIYTVALHRHLRRLSGLRDAVPEYRPETHLGGVIYLFVRGMDGTGTNGVYADRPDPALIERLDALFDGNEET